MHRKRLALLAVAALAAGTLALTADPTAAAPRTSSPASAKHTVTYTEKHAFQTRDGKLVKGIRTGTGKVFVGVDQVTETTVPAAPDTADAFSKMGYVEDQAIWTGSNDAYNYELFLRADVGWQAQADGTYDSYGPFQYREAPACYRYPKGGGTSTGTNCNFAWYNSALEAKRCGANESCMIEAPWGFRDFYQADVQSVLFAGGWHNLANLPDPLGPGDSLQACTSDATARFKVPNHLTQIYFAGSFWWTIVYHPTDPSTISSDSCTGLTRIS